MRFQQFKRTEHCDIIIFAKHAKSARTLENGLVRVTSLIEHNGGWREDDIVGSLADVKAQLAIH